MSRRCLAVLALFCLPACSENGTNPALPGADPGGDGGGGSGSGTVNWPAIRAGDRAETAPGWSESTRLETSGDSWEEGLFVSLGGSRAYFAVYPGVDRQGDRSRGRLAGATDQFQTTRPYQSLGAYRSFYLSEAGSSAGGLQVTVFDDHYYHSDRDVPSDGVADDDIYRDATRLDFNSSGNERNPHFCHVTNELFFDLEGRDIMVWDGEAVTRLPSPVNADGGAFSSREPFLTEDCQTLYFASTRDGESAIYRSVRTAGSWSSPERLVWSRAGVGDPSLPATEDAIFFVQRFVSPAGAHTTDLFFVERTP